MIIKKNDFIEIEFTGRIKGTEEIFDTNIREEAKKAELNLDIEKLKPFVMAVGNKMLPEGFDKDLTGKEVGKNYSVDIKPEEAFGKRNPQMIKMVPLNVFHEQKINPQRGMQLTLGGQLARVLSSSGGRVLVDLNNPLAGKEVKYNYKINKIITDINEKIDAIQDFLFKKKFPFSVKEKILTLELKEEEKQLEQFIPLMFKPFEEILGLKTKVEIKKAEALEKNEAK